MANNKFQGYTPDPKKEKTVEGTEAIDNRLDRVNPYEFRKGMDYELTSMGCSRLAESTVEERQKATEIVLENLEEHQSYYSGLIQYTTGMDHAKPINETSFKKWLAEQDANKMQEVKNAFKFGKMKDADFKNDKMEKPKYNKKDYTTQLKEAIKNEVVNLLKEDALVKSRSSYNDVILIDEKDRLLSVLKNLGYYNSSLEIIINDQKDNLIDLTFKIKLGEKARIKKLLLLETKFLKIEN